MILGTVKIFCYRGLVIFKSRLFSKWAFFLHISSNMLLVLTLPALIKESFTKFDVIEYYIFAIRLGSLCALQVLYRGDNNHGGAMERGRFEETRGPYIGEDSSDPK